MEKIRIPRPDDWHVHLRYGSLLGAVVDQTAQIYRRALIMLNTIQPILTCRDAWYYHYLICGLTGDAEGPTAKGFFLSQ